MATAEEQNVTSDEVLAATGSGLTVAQRARVERQRLRARALRDARLVQRPPVAPTDGGGGGGGGGFLPDEAEETQPPRLAERPAPVVDPAERPRCEECSQSFATSYLFDSFSHPVCDACRDDADAHALVTRTEAKSLYLLKDCDLDLRSPALRCVRRRNPHGARRADMRLYLRPQLEARALQVWGSEEALERERERRDEARARSQHKLTQRRLRALRMDVRSSLFDRTRAAHTHEFGPERYDDDADLYERECLQCGHKESYEKM